MGEAARVGRDPVTGLPDGAVLRLRRDTRVSEGGRALVGGAPTRVMYLTPKAQALMSGRDLVLTSAASKALGERLLDAGMADPVLDSLPEPPWGVADVTFVVPAYGRAAGLDRLLASLPAGHPAIVVDDASPDPAPIAAAAARHGARLVRLEVNVGPGGARNAGLVHVATSFVAFVDTDVVIDDRVVPALLRHFADPRLAVAAPRVLGLHDGTATNWIGRYEAARSSLDLGPTGGTVRPRAPISWVPATFLLARTDTLGDGFAELREGEDVDLVWRLAAAGHRIRYEPAVSVAHDHRTTLRGWLSRKAFYGSSAAPLAARHGSLLAPAVFAPWGVVFAGALLAQRRWSVPVALGVAGFATVRIARKLRSSRHPYQEAARLTADGVGVTLAQTSALLVRHWWPAAVLAALLSKRAARAVAVAALVDGVVEYARLRPRLDPVRFIVARRLDDLAYGFGVWASVVRRRSARALLPEVGRLRRRG